MTHSSYPHLFQALEKLSVASQEVLRRHEQLKRQDNRVVRLSIHLSETLPGSKVALEKSETSFDSIAESDTEDK
ncbi:hypothetical protein BDF19DRAFT_446876 [Syncephalis fuscata]|nr:hypothetical protein BDF19DRAFT_446876 [Syncephalis fuscata]